MSVFVRAESLSLKASRPRSLAGGLHTREMCESRDLFTDEDSSRAHLEPAFPSGRVQQADGRRGSVEERLYSMRLLREVWGWSHTGRSSNLWLRGSHCVFSSTAPPSPNHRGLLAYLLETQGAVTFSAKGLLCLCVSLLGRNQKKHHLLLTFLFFQFSGSPTGQIQQKPGSSFLWVSCTGRTQDQEEAGVGGAT